MRNRNESALGVVWAAGLVMAGCFSDPVEELAPGDASTGAGTSTTGDVAETDGGDDSSSGFDDGGTTSSSSSSGVFETEGPSSTGADLGRAEVRLVHASPDAGAVDVYAAGAEAPLLEGVDYLESSVWLTVPAGTVELELRPAGARPRSEPVFAQSLSLEDGDRVSAVAAGLLDGEADDALRLLAVAETWGNDLAGRARIQVVHAGSDAPTVVVDGLDGEPAELDRFGNTAGPGIPVGTDGGERIQILSGGDEVTTFTTPPIAEGDQVLVVATGLLGSLAREADGFSLLAVGEGGALPLIRQDPQLFILHGARDAGNLETCTDSTELAGNFEYGEIQSARLSPGAYPLSIYDYPSGCTGVPVNTGGNSTGELEAGERYLLLVTGERNPEGAPPAVEPGIQVATLQDRFTLDEDADASIRFVHGASAQQIYVGSLTGEQIVGSNVYTSPIGWRAESEETALMPGFYLLGIADAVDKPAPPLDPLVNFNFDSVAGARQWGIVSGDPSPEPGDGFVQLMVVDTIPPVWSVSLVDVNVPD